MPERTDGGHRIYSEADIECLLWLIARQDEGMNISQAAELWKSLEDEGRTPTTADQSPLNTLSSQSQTEGPVVYQSARGGVIEDLRQRWIEASTAFDERTAEQVLAQAFALYPPETVCIELLQRGLGQIGIDWYRGRTTAQQEHFASALAMRRLEALLTAAPDPTRSQRIVVACPPRENHTFSPLLTTLLLRRRGWDVVYLGADVPTEQLAETVRMTKPALVLLVAQQLQTAAALMEMAYTLRPEKTQVAYGGQVFNIIPALRERIPGFFLGTELAMTTTQVERLLAQPPAPPAAIPVDHRYHEALNHFLEHQMQIDADVWHEMSEQGMPKVHLSAAKQNLGDGIVAAMTLGNLDYLGTDLNWVAGLLSYRQISSASLVHYLSVYKQFAAQYLSDGPGSLLIDWLENLLRQHHPQQMHTQRRNDAHVLHRSENGQHENGRHSSQKSPYQTEKETQ
jgi:methanogenic corrinoid protein MtbC1